MYWKLKQGALAHTLWRIHFGRGYGTVVRLCDDTDKTMYSIMFSYVLCLVLYTKIVDGLSPNQKRLIRQLTETA